MKITYGEFPTIEQQIQVKDLIDKYRNRIPNYLFRLIINYRDKPKSKTCAEIKTQTPYCEACIVIYPAFWSISNEEREEVIIHELCHLHFASLSRLCNQVITAHGPEDPSFLFSQAQDVLERSVSELSHTLLTEG